MFSLLDHHELYHDSGTSKTMINYEPDHITKHSIKIPVFTAGKHQPPETGINKGTIQVGSIEIEALQVPSFSKNLLSATQLAREHGCKQTIQPWTGDLVIEKDNQVVATGSYDEQTKLIKMDKSNIETTMQTSTKEDWITIHRKLGHAGKTMMHRTLKATYGL